MRFCSFRTPAAAINVEFRREQIGTVDGEENLILLHLVADIGIGIDDSALIGRKDLRQNILIEVDIADSLPLQGKIHGTDLVDLYRRDLLLVQIERKFARSIGSRRF